MPECQSGPCAKYIPAHDPLKNGGYARLESLRMVLVDDDLPTVSPSGPFFDLAYGYINGTQTYELTTSASDPGSGIERAWLERVGAGELASSDAPCDPTHNTPALDSRICPQSWSFTTQVDTSVLPEGRSDFVVEAADVAGNVGQSDPWPIFVDRTPPTPVGAEGFSVSWYDRDSHDAAVAWAEGSDPDLPDGSPGSGIAGYEYRYDRAGTGWSEWTASEKSEVLVPGVALGDEIAIEVRATDDVGNVSDAVGGSLVVDDTAPLPPDDEPDAPTVCKDGAPAGSCDFQIGADGSGLAGVSVVLPAATPADDAAAAAAAATVNYTRSIYEHQATTSILDAQGCNAGKAKVRGAVILAFGRPAWDGDNYGTVNYDGRFISNIAIQKGAKAFVRGFVRCSGVRGGTMKVAIGTTNGCVNGQDKECCPRRNCGLQVPNFRAAGALWLRDVEALADYIAASPARTRQAAARGADDIEPAWEPAFTRTHAFIDAYNDTGTFQAMYDFGSGERGFWTVAQRYSVAYGLKQWPFPQIYLETMADDWEVYARYKGNFGKMYFYGVLSQWRRGETWLKPGDDCGLTPTEGRKALLDRIDQTSIPYLSDIVCHT